MTYAECCVGLEILGEVVYIAGLEIEATEPDRIARLSSSTTGGAILVGLPNHIHLCILAQALTYAREYMLTGRSRVRNENILLLMYIMGETQISNVIEKLRKNKIRCIYILSHSKECCVRLLKSMHANLNFEKCCIYTYSEQCPLEELARLASTHLSFMG